MSDVQPRHRQANLAKYVSTDNDPLFRFHRLADLRIVDIEEIKTVPFVPQSHSFVERVIGTLRREYLDHLFFWNGTGRNIRLHVQRLSPMSGSAIAMECFICLLPHKSWNSQQTGIKVSNVEIKRIDLNESMIRAIAKQAEAERERRAKVIHAEGELQASEKLLQAAQTLAKNPQSMQLRYLQTLTEIAGERGSIIAFPLPIDLIKPWMERAAKTDNEAPMGSNSI